MATNGSIHYSNLEVLPDKNGVNNTYFTQVIGNKTDEAASTADTTSIVGLLRYIIANLSSDTDLAALIGALNTAAHTGAVDNATTTMGYIKQLITDLRTVKGDLDNGGRLDLLIDAIKVITDALPNSGALTSLAQDLTVAKEATLGTPTGASISADILNLQADMTQAISLVSTSDSSGTFSYLDAGAEQIVFTLTTSTRKIIDSIWVDCVNLTNNGSFKVYYKVDGTNYRLVSTSVINGGTTTALNLITGSLAITNDMKITYTEASDEAAARAIPYSIIFETKE